MFSLLTWLGDHVPGTFHSLKTNRRESHRWRKLLSKGLMLSAGLELRTGCRNGDHAGVWKLGKECLQTSPAVTCGLEKVPSESIRDPWLSLDCCQETLAALKLEHRQNAERSQWICREKR